MCDKNVDLEMWLVELIVIVVENEWLMKCVYELIVVLLCVNMLEVIVCSVIVKFSVDFYIE